MLEVFHLAVNYQGFSGVEDVSLCLESGQWELFAQINSGEKALSGEGDRLHRKVPSLSPCRIGQLPRAIAL